MFNVPEISPQEAKDLLEREGENIVLLDVRTPPEHYQQRIPGSELVPMDDLRFRFNELPKDRKYIVYCRSGERSAFATYFLRHMGFEAYNLTGGIISWPYETEVGAPSS